MESPLILTNGQLESVVAGLSSLDGLNLKDGFIPFKFDDDTTWDIAVNIDIVNRAIGVLNTARKSLAKQNAVTERMAITPENSGRVAAFMEGLDALLAKEVALPGLVKISRGKLNVGQGDKKNAIPSSVLAKLMPILE